jgi:hypothetical protein
MKPTLTLLTALLLAPLAYLHAADVPQTSPTHRVLFVSRNWPGSVTACMSRHALPWVNSP